MAGSYNAGIVTAYGAAVRGGYTGTYEQFCAQQANYAQTAAAVEQAKTDAQAAAQRAQDVADSIPEDYTELTEEVSNLKEDLSYVIEIAQYNDAFGSNLAITAQYEIRTFTWYATEKTLSLPCATDTLSSQRTGWAVVTPKTQVNHDYVLAVRFSSTRNTSSTTYIRNLDSPYNYNVGQRISEATMYENGATQVFKFTADRSGWLAFGIVMAAGIEYTTGMKLALYDVTGTDIDAISDAEWLQFADVVTAPGGGAITDIMRKADYSYSLADNNIGEKWTALGDSLTASGSGALYLGYVKERLGLATYNNCGIGGTAISGAQATSAMYQDVRINALNLDSNCVTVMGGTNDFWQQYYKDHPNSNLTGWGDCTRDNHDVSTFCGAYNVLISKILYKFCKIPAYYSDIDYTGITQVDTAIDNFRLILITPPQAFHVDGDSASASLLQNGITAAHSYVKQIAELWSLPCVDSWEMGMNDINKPLFFTNYLADATHFNAFGHKRLASLIINKALQVSRYM